MNSLIAIQNGSIGGDTVQTVNARELHAFLEIGKKFSDWVKERIEQYGFVDGADFTTTDGLSVPESGSAKARAQKTIEYHITLAMGKELAMVERNAKGKEARTYFIECERRTKAPLQIETPEMQMARGLIAAQTVIEDKTRQIAQRDTMIADLSPKAAIADRLVIADGALNLTQAAKVLNVQPKRFNASLASLGWIYRMGVKGSWTGYGTKIKAGYLEHKMHTYQHTDGTDDVSAQVLITAKGMSKLAELLMVA